MTSTSATPPGWSNTDSEHRIQSRTGHFMLTLCRLPGPVAIRPPQSPQLKAFTFFTTRERGEDGAEHSYLHMGYFETLADAERWAEGVRSRFPNAIATLAPKAFTRPAAMEVTGSQPPDPQSHGAQSSCGTAVEDRALSDTQVLKILELRSARRPGEDVDPENGDPVALLRPEDTGTRQALKKAVVQGAPVCFAVQLQWSVQPIDFSRLPSLPLFRTHTLYGTESRREGRSRYFLRLGFFGDPISANEVAAEMRATFTSVAVVPVSDQEVRHAREAGKNGASIPTLVQQEINRAPDSNGNLGPAPASEPVSEPRRRAFGNDRKLELELRRLARKELWTNPDLLSDSGVRHLKVNVESQRRTQSPD
jgi:hypothetical protein